MAAKGIAGKAQATRATGALVAFVSAPAARQAREAAMGYALEDLSNYARVNGPYIDRTGALRNSIGWEITRSTPTRTTGVFYAKKHYARYVEFIPGYWVLSGAWKARRLALTPILGEGLTAKRMSGFENFMGPLRHRQGRRSGRRGRRR